MNSAEWIADLPWNEINYYAEKYGLNKNWIAAFIMNESMNNRYAMRYEMAWKYLLNPKEFADQNGLSVNTEVIAQSCSWGLMQLMGSVARELGYTGHLPMLTEINLGLDLGCKKLKAIMQKYTDIHDAAAAYNAGSVRKTPGGFYENQKYVDRFDSFLRALP